MLIEITVRDFAIIEALRLEMAPGFNVVTGETGAGKSIVVDAVELLLGARADTGYVRAGAEKTIVEGVFEPGPARERIETQLEEYGIATEDQLIVSREVHAAGRSTARINGRAVPARALVELGRHLVDLHGQSDNAALMRESEHLDLLDRYAGLEEPRTRFFESVSELRSVRRSIQELMRDEAELARRVTQLEFEIEEINSAKPSEGEEEGLLSERNLLSNAERLASAADKAYLALTGDGADDAGGGALDRIDLAGSAMMQLGEIDAAMRPVQESLVSSLESLRDAAAQLRDYRDGMAFNPERLEEVEERLAVLGDIKRKYGPDIPSVLRHLESAEQELATIDGADEKLRELKDAEAQLLSQLGATGSELAKARRQAAERLATAVEAELESLGMTGGSFQVGFSASRDEEGICLKAPDFDPDQRYAFDERGADKVAFQVSMNAGEPPRALVRVASGGEAARLMLALKTILSSADDVPTMIFDEIDAGIGGRIGSVVGEKLWYVSDRRQVICVTHLSQVAAYGDAHFKVSKTVDGGRTSTRIHAVQGGDRVEELMAMLGSETEAARENALQLLQKSELWKVTAREAMKQAVG